MFKLPADFGKFPMLDFGELAALNQRNFEAVVAANQAFAAGMQQAFKRQAEIVQGAIKDGLDAAREASLTDGTVDLQKQLAYVKNSTEKSVAGSRELADLWGKGGTAAAEILRQRVSASFDEVKGLVKTAA